MASYRSCAAAAFVALVTLSCAACGNSPGEPSPVATDPSQPVATPTPPVKPATIASDAELFTLVTATQPFRSYTLFPNLNLSPTGTLTASSAHQPIIRVSINDTARAALQNGRLPAGTSFPDGSIIFKEVLAPNGNVNVYAVMFKDSRNGRAGNGWLWAELRPNGSADYSIADRGGSCTGCHSLADGTRNDRVRIFERQQ